MIIGLTGSCCSGKDTIADYVSNRYGYKHFSLSDIIREAMKEAGVEPTRENLIDFGNKLRKNNGNDILAKKVTNKIENSGKYCITSIRHSEEVNELKKIKGFILINVDAPQDVRFERLQKRKRYGDSHTFEKFIEFENKENQTSGSEQQLKKTASMADITFINDSNDISTLKLAVDKLLKDLENRFLSAPSCI